MLTPEQQLLWKEYIHHEEVRIRDVSLDALEQFILAIESTSIEVWSAWVFDISRRAVDEDEDIPIRLPLFRRVLFPALYDGYQNRFPGCARWLSGFEQLLYQSPDCQAMLGGENASAHALLKVALEHEPEDVASQQRLVKIMANRFDYALHELPTGVLYGMNGATVEQCKELEEELTEFCRLVAKTEQEALFAELISVCSDHFAGYQEYLQQRSNYQSYEDYTNQHGLPLW